VQKTYRKVEDVSNLKNDFSNKLAERLLSLTIKPGDAEVLSLHEESQELARIVGKSILTAKRNAAR
jgi:hypothetical protein